MKAAARLPHSKQGCCLKMFLLEGRNSGSGVALGEDYAFGGAGFLDGIVVGPPLLPGLRVVPEGFAGDETKRTVDPAARIRIQGIVIQKIQEIRDCGEALFVGEHAGFSDADGGKVELVSNDNNSVAILGCQPS